MGSVRIVAPKGHRLADDFDPIGRRTAEFLGDLLPGIDIVLAYSLKHASVAGRLDGDGTLASWGSSVPEDPQWQWTLTLLINNKNRAFIGDEGVSTKIFDIGGARGFDHWLRTGLPLKYVISTAIGVITELGYLVSPKSPKLVSESLSKQLPLYYVAEFLARLWYHGGEKARELSFTITRVMEHLESLSRTRVEHQALSHGVVITPTRSIRDTATVGKYPKDFSLKRTPLLADGTRTALRVSRDGGCTGLITLHTLQAKKKNLNLARSTFGPLGLLAAASEYFSGISIGLRRDHSLVVFVKGDPLFIKRGRRWQGTMWWLVKDVLYRKFGDVGRVVFDAAISLSITEQGGVLGIVEAVPKGILEKDRVDIARRTSLQLRAARTIHNEWQFHRILPTDNVVQLGSSFLAMLAAIDGATLIHQNGQLLAYGAVVPSRPGGSEGARSAAARQLSNNGFVIKVSADGPITLYARGAEVFEV